MKASEMRKLSDAELQQQMDDLAAEAMKLRFQQATMQLTHVARVQQVRGNISRIKTILTERATQQGVMK